MTGLEGMQNGLEGREKTQPKMGVRGVGAIIVRVVVEVPLSKTSTRQFPLGRDFSPKTVVESNVPSEEDRSEDEDEDVPSFVGLGDIEILIDRSILAWS